MKRLLLLILVLSACDGAELPTAPTAIAPAAPDEGSLVEQSARAFIKALQKCDREQATAGTLTFEEISSIAKRQVDKATGTAA